MRVWKHNRNPVYSHDLIMWLDIVLKLYYFASLLFRLINANISVNEQPEWFHWTHRWWSFYTYLRHVHVLDHGHFTDIHPWDVVFPRAKAFGKTTPFGWTIMMFTLISAGIHAQCNIIHLQKTFLWYSLSLSWMICIYRITSAMKVETDIITDFLNLAFCWEPFISIKHRILKFQQQYIFMVFLKQSLGLILGNIF
jgi:hypothetical protein